jgi:hypothetical protein
VSHVAVHFPAAEAAKLAKQLQTRLGAFSLAPGGAAAHVHALATLTKPGDSDGDADTVPPWFWELSAGAGVVLVGRCRSTVSKPVFKAPIVSALEISIS